MAAERSLTVAALPLRSGVQCNQEAPMRTLGAISLSLFLAAALSAQHGGQPVLRGTGGSVVYPAGTSGGVHLIVPDQNNRRVPPAHGSRLIASPVYLGGYYDSSYIAPQAPPDYQEQQQPNITIVMPPQTPVPVIINNYYPGATTDNPNAEPTPQQAAEEAAAASEPSHYLIAYQDHTIYAAVAYGKE